MDISSSSSHSTADLTTSLAETVSETTSATWERACDTAERIRDGLTSAEFVQLCSQLSSVQTLDHLNDLLNR